MNKLLSPILLSALVLLLSAPLCIAQSTVNETAISVQVRPRAEYRNGALTPRNEGVSPATFINNRARIALDYKRNDLEMRVAAQHVGVWGQDPQIDRNGRFMLNEAWAKLKFANNFFALLGRQSLVYDDERILGGLDWNTSGRFHDALKLGYEDEANKLHLILAFNQNEERVNGGSFYASGGQPYKSMQTLWYQYKKGENPFSLSALFLNIGQEGGSAEASKTRYMQTFGANLGYALNGFKIGGTAYLQTGKTASDQKVSAWMAGLNAALALDSQWTVSAGSDYLSGNDVDKESYNAFNPLYGTHHKFYGSMDYFYASSFANGLNPGLWDSYLRIDTKASAKVNLQLTYHYFSTAKAVVQEGAELSKGLGSEIDFQLDWSMMKDVKLSAGYSVMLGTDAMNYVKGGNNESWQDWGWVSLNINPRVFFAKW